MNQRARGATLTNGPAIRNAPDSEEFQNVAAAVIKLQESYDELATELAKEASGGGGDLVHRPFKGP